MPDGSLAGRTEMGSPLLQLVGVAKTYRTLRDSAVVALSPTTLEIRPGEFVSIVGPSGCGKTTLLNLMAGLIRPSAGRILFRGRNADGPSTEVGLVFQRPVLLPWRRVLDNVLLPVEVIGLRPRAAYREKARTLLAMVGLAGFEDAYPRELSGGMQQRAAIARALVYDSSVLLMDEPFAALDAMTREELNLELLRIWQATGRTIIFVTHNIAEAVLLSDRIVVMTPRPGQVKAVIEVDLARPRSLALLGEPRFGQLAAQIRALLRPPAQAAA
jgi:NitT/TauT family transport system ATP-binding protein